MIHRLLLTHIVGSIIDKRVISVWRCSKSCKNDPQFGNEVSTLISGAGYSGIRILNIQLDGNRPNAGYINGGE
jgi:hypothetical protein